MSDAQQGLAPDCLQRVLRSRFRQQVKPSVRRSADCTATSNEKVMSLAGGYDEYAFVADFYDHVVPYRSRPDVTFFVDAARESGGRVLEVGCGTRRILIPTARAGVEVVGLDFSTHMLTVCRARLAQEPEAVRSRVELAHGDMRSFDLGKTFTLATVPFRPFQHLLTVDDQLSCLSRIRHHLIDGGRLILDIFNPQDRGTADPARSVFHLAARGKLLDRAVVSPDSPAHRAAGVASDMIGADDSTRCGARRRRKCRHGRR